MLYRAVRGLLLLAIGFALAGCGAHEIYGRPGLDPSMADRDWAECQAEALTAAGQATTVKEMRNMTSVSGEQLRGELAPLTLRAPGVMVSPDDYVRIKKREAALHACMERRGYQFLGVPATEML